MLWDGDKVRVDRVLPFGHAELWSHAVKRRYAEKSFVELESVQMGTTPFAHYENGLDLTAPAQEQLIESLRHWSEACDRLTSLRIVWDVDSGWGGVAEFFVQTFAEEHQKSFILGIPLADTRGATLSSNWAASITKPEVQVLVPVSGTGWPAQLSYRAMGAKIVDHVFKAHHADLANAGKLYCGITKLGGNNPARGPGIVDCDFSIAHETLSRLPLEEHELWNVRRAGSFIFGQCNQTKTWLGSLTKDLSRRNDGDLVDAVLMLQERI